MTCNKPKSSRLEARYVVTNCFLCSSWPWARKVRGACWVHLWCAASVYLLWHMNHYQDLCKHYQTTVGTMWATSMTLYTMCFFTGQIGLEMLVTWCRNRHPTSCRMAARCCNRTGTRWTWLEQAQIWRRLIASEDRKSCVEVIPVLICPIDFDHTPKKA